ncbi:MULTISPECIES: hypothetical protein [Kribbella]|uniref:TrkA domain protein n=1 Tax=Kribbella karoonensis TaxID=324851 RepID=A0ABP4NVJ7_9ACTN
MRLTIWLGRHNIGLAALRFTTARTVRGGDPAIPAMERVFIPGDEIMIVFSATKIRDMGYTDPRFVV